MHRMVHLAYVAELACSGVIIDLLVSVHLLEGLMQEARHLLALVMQEWVYFPAASRLSVGIIPLTVNILRMAQPRELGG